MKRFLKCVLAVTILFGCSSKEKEEKSIVIDEYADTIEEQYYDTFMIDMNESDFYSYFEVEPNQIKQMVYKEAFLDVKADALVMIEVSDDTIINGIQTKLENRLQEIQDEFETYIPEVYEIAKNGQVIVINSYIFMIVNENSDAIVEDIKSKLEE